MEDGLRKGGIGPLYTRIGSGRGTREFLEKVIETKKGNHNENVHKCKLAVKLLASLSRTSMRPECDVRLTDGRDSLP